LLFFFQAEDGIRDFHVTGVQTCALPICWFRAFRLKVGSGHWFEPSILHQSIGIRCFSCLYIKPNYENMYSVYILYSLALDRYYVGMTSNIQQRLKKHNANSKGFTKKANDWTVKYIEKYNNKNDAEQRERKIKSWKSRKMIDKLISEAGSEHSD